MYCLEAMEDDGPTGTPPGVVTAGDWLWVKGLEREVVDSGVDM